MSLSGWVLVEPGECAADGGPGEEHLPDSEECEGEEDEGECV